MSNARHNPAHCPQPVALLVGCQVMLDTLHAEMGALQAILPGLAVPHGLVGTDASATPDTVAANADDSDFDNMPV